MLHRSLPLHLLLLPQNFVILLALATHRSKTTTIALVRRCTPLGNVLNPPAQRLKRLAHVIIQYKTNVLSRYSDTIYGLPASSYVAFRGPQRYSDTIYQLPMNRGAM
ncbi:hypothetical protein BJ912DRAFT_995760, partial [Pholiota molesta]